MCSHTRAIVQKTHKNGLMTAVSLEWKFQTLNLYNATKFKEIKKKHKVMNQWFSAFLSSFSSYCCFHGRHRQHIYRQVCPVNNESRYLYQVQLIELKERRVSASFIVIIITVFWQVTVWENDFSGIKGKFRDGVKCCKQTGHRCKR